jgi:DNA-binding CsgD family transcriptional regulator/tetratricopeptide (TPR) repeat protein
VLERRSEACYLTDDQLASIAALEEAVACRREAGDLRGQGLALSRLVPSLACRGRMTEAAKAAREAVELLEAADPCRELAEAYNATALVHLYRGDRDATIESSRRAADLAERFEDETAYVDAMISIGTSELFGDGPEARGTLEGALARARRTAPALVPRALNNLAHGAVFHRSHDLAERYVGAGLAHCAELDLDLWSLSLLMVRARSELERGLWTEAAETARHLIDDPHDSPEPTVTGLLTLALVRARRGDPDTRTPIAEALGIEFPADELSWTGPVTAARAEIAWLEGRSGEVEDLTDPAFELARRHGAGWWLGVLADWRRRAGLRESAPSGAAEPYALQLAGDWRGAAAAWARLGCPYEAALALSDADDEEALRRGLEECHRLGARPLATRIARSLRERGALAVPRGPRPSTCENPARLTSREMDVLRLVSAGLANGDIAERLFLSPRTVGHHVSAVLRKLGTRTRGEAVAEAARLGLLENRPAEAPSQRR